MVLCAHCPAAMALGEGDAESSVVLPPFLCSCVARIFGTPLEPERSLPRDDRVGGRDAGGTVQRGRNRAPARVRALRPDVTIMHYSGAGWARGRRTRCGCSACNRRRRTRQRSSRGLSTTAGTGDVASRRGAAAAAIVLVRALLCAIGRSCPVLCIHDLQSRGCQSTAVSRR